MIRFSHQEGTDKRKRDRERERKREKQTEREACTEHANISIPIFPSGGWEEGMVAVQLISISCITYIQLDRLKV